MERQILWRPGIGDPSFMGWFTVVAYVVAALLCGLAAREVRSRAPSPGRAPFVWRSVGFLFALLAINKQLDLQSLFTDIGRCIVAQFGWLDQRRSLQRVFIVVVVAVAFAVFAALGWTIRRNLREYGLLLAGVMFTTTFIAVRAVSFHHVDEWLGSELAGVRMNWFLELTGIGLVTLAAVIRVARARRG